MIRALKRLAPSYFQTIEERVADAHVRVSPFPHLYIPNLLSPRDCDQITRHWPARVTMGKEGDLDRSFFDLVHDDVDCIYAISTDIQPFWRSLVQSSLAEILRGIASAFSPYIVAKFGDERPAEIALQIHRLMCLEADQGFVEHAPHSHIAAPNWVFTFLLYIDDVGRGDRGTTLYEPSHEVDFSQTAKVMSGTHSGVRRVFDAPFRQGALLAFFDCAMSLHGSTPFQDAGVDFSRRIIRSHVSLGPREVERIFGMPTEDLNSSMAEAGNRYAALKDPSVYDGFAVANEMALNRKIAARGEFSRRRDLCIRFPALED